MDKWTTESGIRAGGQYLQLRFLGEIVSQLQVIHAQGGFVEPVHVLLFFASGIHSIWDQFLVMLSKTNDGLKASFNVWWAFAELGNNHTPHPKMSLVVERFDERVTYLVNL